MDEVTKRWFDVAKVAVVRSPESVGWHSDEELIRLSGAPSGSRLTVSTAEGGKTQLLVENDEVLAEPMVRYIVQEPQGYVFHIVNFIFSINARLLGTGIGPRSVGIEITEAARLGYFSRIRTLAVGDRGSKGGANPLLGYFVWPRMGFDADLPPALLEHPDLPPAHRQDRRLLALTSSVEGQAFWKRHGSTLWLEFDLSSQSTSWQTLRRYLASQHIEVES